MTTRRALEERRDRALDDLVELERQIAAEEVSADQAAFLRTRYEADAAEALRALEAWEPAPPGRSPRRLLIGAAAAVGIAIALVVAVAAAIEPRQAGGFATGGAPTVTTQVDLDDVSNEEMEAVVADNPDITPMRLALARRYVEAGEFSSALPHYFYILEREQHPEALAYVGWMTYLSGDLTTGESYLRRSLAVDEDYVVAQWFLANLYYHGADDPESARPLLEALVTSPEVPTDVAAEAEAMLRGDA